MKETESLPRAGGLPAGQSPVTSDDTRVIAAMREYLAALEAGNNPDRQEFVAGHTEIASILEEALEGLDFIHAALPRDASGMERESEGLRAPRPISRTMRKSPSGKERVRGAWISSHSGSLLEASWGRAA